ncbi:hypothetical protein ACFO0M_00815 [Micromonospora mangrovi]|uniref:Oxidoreductase FAD/NAD(P)-binding domain-containing protein n=2 Tax=Micromonospora TaxID=1873 RepID=A0AAU8HNW0_9ACTN
MLWLGPPTTTGLTLDPHSSAPLLLAAGGTGLTPLRAVVEHLGESPTGRHVTLVVGARTLPELHDPIALDKLDTRHEWLTPTVVAATLVPWGGHCPARCSASPSERRLGCIRAPARRPLRYTPESDDYN